MSFKLPGVSLVLLIVSLIISSWFMIHLLAFFGIFLAIVYPFCWFLFPKRMVCFLCRFKKTKEDCPHKNLLSVFLNTLFIFFISLISTGIVFFESKILAGANFISLSKPASFSIPAKGQYRLGEIFPLKVEIEGIKAPVNAVQADLKFDPDKLEAIEFSTKGSFANIFIQKDVDNKSGYARLTGGLPNPGFFSEKGLFGTVFFKGKKPGVVRVEFLPSSMILSNDGKGTNIINDLLATSYLILPDKISPEEEKAQESSNFTSMVLGEATGESQMKFYEEEEVLGEKREEQTETKKKGFLVWFLQTLHDFDTFVVNQWTQLVKLR